MDREEALLVRLAEVCGVLPGYHDIWGRYHRADPDTLRAVLRAMGLDVAGAEALEGELALRETAPSRCAAEPVAVLREEAPQVLRVTVPSGEESWQASARLGGRVVPLRRTGTEPAPGWPGRLTLLLEPASPLPAGLHDLELDLASPCARETARLLCVVAPARGYEPPALARGGRLWGVSLPLYGVRSARNWGVGDFEDLARAVEWAAGLGADLVGLLPLHALFNEPPHGVSPYYPSSRLWLNPLHVAVDCLPEARLPPVQELLESDGVQAELARLRASPLVDHRGAWLLKRRALEVCYREFQEGEAVGRRAAFAAWRAAQGRALEDFAVFCALREHLATPKGTTLPWTEWPEGFRRPGSPAVRAFAGEAQEAVGFHAWLQWVAETQLARCRARAQELGMALGLYLDLALGVDPCGADAWVYQDVLALGASAGAPPDPFSLLGQSWGVPPAVPERHRRTGWAFFRDTLAHNARRGEALRIDHVLALWRLFWIPGGLPASRGAYVTDRADELLAVLRCLGNDHRCLVVGEDLGTVPPEVRQVLETSGFYGYRLLVFEKHGDGRFRQPAEYPRQALVSVATHDLPTVDGFWLGRDLEVKSTLGQYPSPEAQAGDAEARRWDRLRLLEALREEDLLPPGLEPAHEVPETRLDDLAAAVHAYLARAPSALFVANLDDLLGEREMQNLPGTLDEHPNWRRRVAVPLEAWPGRERAAGIAAAIRREGRGDIGP